MKKILLLSTMALFFASTLMVSTGCGDDPEPIPADTTDNNTHVQTPDVVFKLNGETKSVILDTNASYAQYSTVDSRTIFILKGRTKEKSEYIEIEMSFNGNASGTYSIANGAANIELNVGEGVRKTQYAPKPREEISIGVTTYGEIGAKCIGTFGGELQATSLASGTVSDGTFEVKRIEDL